MGHGHAKDAKHHTVFIAFYYLYASLPTVRVEFLTRDAKSLQVALLVNKHKDHVFQIMWVPTVKILEINTIEYMLIDPSSKTSV